MEFLVSSFMTIIFATLFLAIVIINRVANPAPKLPPGPWKLPIIGNLHQLTSSLPHHALRELANKHGPFMHLKLGEVSTLIVSSPEFAKEILQTHDVTFSSRPRFLATEIMMYGSSDLGFAPYGEYWRQVRKIFMVELLSSSRVQSFKPLREEEFSNLVGWVRSNAGVCINLSEGIILSTFSITSRAAFGKKWKNKEVFISIVKKLTEAASGFELADLFPSVRLLRTFSGSRIKLEKFHRVADKLLDEVIDEHKAKLADSNKKSDQDDEEHDLLDVLLKFYGQSDSSGFSLKLENVKALIMDIFSGGTDTSSTVVDWTMAEIMKNPRVLNKVQQEVRQVFSRTGSIDETSINEMTYLKCVIKEVIRLHPPTLLVPRECQENCEIRGYEIPEKTKVIINVWAMGRDPKYWTEPETFIPERFVDSSIDYKGTNLQYIPFGAGRRKCPGMSFGMANVELPLALLLYHFDWELPNGMTPENMNMDESFGGVVRRKEELHLIPRVYFTSPNPY